MTLQPITIDTFGGLMLEADPEEVGLGQAVDCLNHDPAARGKLRARPGTETFFSLGSSIFAALTSWPHVGVGDVLVAAQRGIDGISVLDEAGAPLSSSTDETGSVVVHGVPGASRVYYAKPGVGIGRINTLYAFGNVAGAPVTTLLAVSAIDNRLISAEGSTLWFSDPGDPETFGANNFVELDPGDGEAITELVTWENSTFAFKRSKFYIFYGNSVDAEGEPVFNYQAVKNTVGPDPNVRATAAAAACTAPDGVYFLALDGIYRTTGGAPVKVSGAIDAWFRRRVDPLAVHVPDVSAARIGLSADMDRLYFGTDEGTFVLDFATGTWAVWNHTVSVARVVLADGIAQFTYLAVATTLLVQAVDNTTDDGDPITWFYRTGVSDLGAPQVKKTWQTQLWGIGTPTAALYADHATADPGASQITLGTAPVAGKGVQRYGRRGTFFSLGLSGTGTDIINSAIIDIVNVRPEGVR